VSSVSQFDYESLLPGVEVITVYSYLGHDLVFADQAAGGALVDVRHPAIGGRNQPIYRVLISYHPTQCPYWMGF
jgi:hypothetical protein